MTVPTMSGITAQTVTTPRLTTRVLFSGADGGIPVLFLHGNLSSATWWEETMLALPEGYRGIAPDQRGYGEADPAKKIDATRGMGDLADDVIALLDQLGIEKTHIVGNSLGGNVVWRLMMDIPERLISVTQVAPGSPFGFGGTKDIDGTPCWDDFAGSGGGLINPNLMATLKAGDASADTPFTVRSILRAGVFKPPFIPAWEDAIVASSLSLHIGEQDYPGDFAPSTNFPYVAPGIWGANNALSPKYRDDLDRLYNASAKPPVLWIRGADDKAVSDAALGDPGTLGQLGFIPNYPGTAVYPSQPMVSQTRVVLDKHAENGGSYQEVVMEDAAHAPFIEKPEMFNEIFHEFLKRM